MEIRGLMDPDVRIQIRLHGMPERNLRGREELMEALQFLKSGRVDQLRVDFLDSRVEMAPGGQAATLFTTLRARLGVTQAPEQYHLELKIHWVLAGSNWVVTQLETVRTYGREQSGKAPAPR